MFEIICAQCNKKFLFYKRNRQFCNNACKYAHSRKEKRKSVCKACGCNFERHESFSDVHHYCSAKCKYEHFYEHKKLDKSPLWKSGIGKYRQIAFEKYPRQCMLCKIKGRIEVHHINHNRYDNRLENLIPLCNKCHRKIDGRIANRDPETGRYYSLAKKAKEFLSSE